jgi:anti-anti-sigma factor
MIRSGFEHPVPALLGMRASPASSDTMVLTVAGEVDMATAGALRHALTDLLQEDGIRHLVVNFAQVSFLDAAGAAALLAAYRLGEAAGVTFDLVNCRPTPLRVLEIVGAEKLLIAPDS